ncbi:MAG TPA: hypothetical protein VGF45_21290, partial [Polyangia bacterium]
MRQSSPSFGRRDFTLGLGAAGLAGLLVNRAHAADPAKPAKPGKSAYPNVKIGYAAITWGDANAKQAIMEVAELGYRGIQLRATITRDWNYPIDLKTD